MRSITTFALTAVLLVTSLAACTAQTAELTVPKAGNYYYWFTYAGLDGKQITTTPSSFKDKKSIIDLPLVKDAPVKSNLYVLNSATGNEAIVPVNAKPAESPKIKIETSDFNRVRRVEVLVTAESNQLPAAAGIVRLESADQPSQTQVIDPSSQGIGYFMDVPTGSAKITVEYGGDKSTSQDIDIPTDHKSPILTVKVPVVGDIETIQAAQTPTSNAGTQSGKNIKNAPKTYNFGTALIGMILFVVILYAVYAILRSRGIKVRQALQQMGVDLPQDQQSGAPAQPAAQADPTICPFCGGKKDPATGACACSIGASSSPTASGSGPRLIATQGTYAGSIFPIGSDSITLGRAETNNVALPQDSTASRKHARISGANSQYTIFDEGSSNGTFVNGVKITEQVLHPGDEIQVGSTKLRFEV